MSKTYRINGKVVNSISNYSRTGDDKQEVKNYAESFSQGLASAPIYCEIKDNITSVGGRKLATFNDYGLAQIEINVKAIGGAGAGVAYLTIKDENDELVVGNVIVNLSTELDLIDSSGVISLYSHVEPGYTLHITSAYALAELVIRGYYRLHNTNSEDTISSFEQEGNNKHKFISDYSVNNSQVLEYNSTEDKWVGATSRNDTANVVNNSLECVMGGKAQVIGSIYDTNNPYTFKEDGYMEYNLSCYSNYWIAAQLTTTLRDENGNIVKQWLEEFVHPKLVGIGRGDSTSTYGHEVKKGWTINTAFLEVGFASISTVIINTKNYLRWDKEPEKAKTKTYKFKDEVVNEINIEQYNTTTQEWEPLNEKSGSINERKIHTKPYIHSGQQSEVIIIGGSEFTCPVDGILSVKFSTNALVEIESNINIDIYDTNGNKVDSGDGRIAFAAVRPTQATYSALTLTEVKKGYKVKINTTGISGGRGWYFLRLDPTYSMVDTNGNYI